MEASPERNPAILPVLRAESALVLACVQDCRLLRRGYRRVERLPHVATLRSGG